MQEKGTMNNRYIVQATFDIEQYNGNYQSHHRSNGNKRTQQSAWGPCHDEYDPTAASLASLQNCLNDTMGGSMAGSPYSPTAASINAAAHHALFLPPHSASVPGPAGLNASAPYSTGAGQLQATSAQQQQNMMYNHQQSSQPSSLSLTPSDLEPVPIVNNRMHQNLHNQNQMPTADSLLSAAIFGCPLDNDLTPLNTLSGSGPLPPQAPTETSGAAEDTDWMDELSFEVAGLSLKPLKAREVISRLREKTDDVVTRYLPCVEFLVACQQELRKGLAIATQKRLIRGHSRNVMTPHQFFTTYINPLPDKFFRKNRKIVEATVLNAAYQEIKKLCSDAQNVSRQGCEAMKNNFLGGMKDGESWGLRKWLSKHGSALYICTDLECILRACQKLDRGLDSTKKLGDMLRPLAKQALKKLKSDVPSSYQEVSSAHPYLPFFHRLESALQAMSNFDPEDDDVICIDDEDEIAEVKAQAKEKKPSGGSSKRGLSGRSNFAPPNKRTRTMKQQFDTNNDSDDDSVIEILAVKPSGGGGNEKSKQQAGNNTDQWYCKDCSAANASMSNSCAICGTDRDSMNDFGLFNADDIVKGGFLTDSDKDESSEHQRNKKGTPGIGVDDHQSVVATARSLMAESRSVLGQMRRNSTAHPFQDAHSMANNLDRLAGIFDKNEQHTVRPLSGAYGSFWDGERYASALRLFGSILREPDSPPFLNRIDEQILLDEGKVQYTNIIKNPLCFRDIVDSLIEETENSSKDLCGCDGRLPGNGLAFWNMWQGMDLLQAIDLVFLNSLAYGRVADEGRSQNRSQTNRLRKTLWSGITHIIHQEVGDNAEMRKQCTPTRRGESSGFVIRKRR